MASFAVSKAGAAIVLGCGLLAQQANAETQAVTFDRLTATATVVPPLVVGDTLFVNTLVTQEIGALTQSVSFTVGPAVESFFAEAAWLVTPAGTGGPRLVGVNIDVLDSGSNVIFSDDFQGVLARFATSTFGGAIGPGSYTLVATGTGQDASSLDIGLTFVGAIPEPQSWALMLAGLVSVGFIGRRRILG